MREAASFREDGHLPEMYPAGEEERQERPPGGQEEAALMENPATWGPAERIIDEILGKIILGWGKSGEEITCGLSAARQIADALRNAGLLKEDA